MSTDFLRIAACLLHLLGAGLLAAMSAASATAQPITFELGMPESDAVKETIAKFQTGIAVRLPERSLQVVPGGMQPPNQVLQHVRTGVIAIGLVPLATTGAPAAEALTQPWQFFSATASNQALASEIGAIAAAQLEQSGVYVLGYATLAFSRVAARATTSNLSGLAGKRISTFSAQSARVMTELGANPVALPAAEVFSATERGLVDAAVVVADSRFGASGYTDVLKSYIEAPYQPVVGVILVNRLFWKALPYKAQRAISGAARSATASAQPVVERQESEFRAYVAAGGANLINLAAADVVEAQNASLRAWTAANTGARADYLPVALAAARARPRTLGQTAVPAARPSVYFATDRVPEIAGDVHHAFTGNGETTRVHFGHAAVKLKEGRGLDDDLDDVAEITSLTDNLAKEAFQEQVRSAERDVLLFVHGYNNDFVDGIRRGAALKQDFGLQGPVVVYSWPSDGTVPAYFSDEASLDVTYSNFRTFLDAIDGAVGRARVSIVAHSMGGRIMLNYLDWAHGRPEMAGRAKFKHIIFAASDITALYFKQILPKLEAAAQAITVYVSGNDRALYTSQQLHNDIRLGRGTGADMFISTAADTIDASDIDKPAFFVDFSLETRHSYVFDKTKGVKDLGDLLRGASVTARPGLQRKQRAPSEFYHWIVP